MVVKGVAARPPNQSDVRISSFGSIIGVKLAGLQQHIGNSRHGNEVTDRIWDFRKGRPGIAGGIAPHGVQRSIAEGVARSRLANLSQDRSQCQARPDRLFPVIGALHAPGHADHRFGCCEIFRQIDNCALGNVGNLRSPGR